MKEGGEGGKEEVREGIVQEGAGEGGREEGEACKS